MIGGEAVYHICDLALCRIIVDKVEVISEIVKAVVKNMVGKPALNKHLALFKIYAVALFDKINKLYKIFVLYR